MFLSTNGTNDDDGNLVFVAYDTDASDGIRVHRTGLRYDDLRATLVKLAERGKILVFFDACHSGNTIQCAKGGFADIDRAAADLASAESGVVVFSSSTGTQLSLELDSRKHVAFTAALLEAFDSPRAAHEPPFLYVTDFDAWLRGRVKELTGSAQTPTVTVPFERLTNPRIFRVVGN